MQKEPFNIPIGKDWQYSFTWGEVDLSVPGRSFSMNVREKPGDPDPPVLALTTANGGLPIDGAHDFRWVLNKAQTGTLDPKKRYTGDLILEDNGFSYPVFRVELAPYVVT